MIAWAIETLFASTLLMILVLVAREPVRKLVGPQIAYALWALPVLRMLLPPMPDAVRETMAAPIGAATGAGTIMMGVPVVDVPALPQGWGMADVPPLLIAIWMVGTAAFAAYHLIAYARFSARLRGGVRSQAKLAAGRVVMIESEAAAGPLAFGIWRKYVAFPVDFSERYDELERDLALAHELGHHARGDLLANWIALATLSIHWFNPIAWRAFRAFRADQEMACDALVLSGRHSALRHAYGRAIVKSAQGGAVSAACHLHTVNEIKGRLRMLTRHERPSGFHRLTGAAGIAALAMAALAFTASGTRAAEGLKASVEDRTGVSLDTIEMPALPVQVVPAPPAPPEPMEPLYADANADHVFVADDENWAKEEARRAAADARRAAANARREAANARRIAANVPVPDVQERVCGGNGPVTLVRSNADGHVVSTVICTDRIERQVERAERQAMFSQGVSVAIVSGRERTMSIARAAIHNARATVVSQRAIPDARRAEALSELDHAMDRVDAEAHVD